MDLTRLQQAIGLTQQAVGQLQGMFKRLAAKMEQDVRALGQAYEKLTYAHNALVDEVKGVREELLRLRSEALRSAPRPASEIVVRPAKSARPIPAPAASAALSVFPPSAEPEDAVWYEGGAEDTDS